MTSRTWRTLLSRGRHILSQSDWVCYYCHYGDSSFNSTPTLTCIQCLCMSETTAAGQTAFKAQFKPKIRNETKPFQNVADKSCSCVKWPSDLDSSRLFVSPAIQLVKLLTAGFRMQSRSPVSTAIWVVAKSAGEVKMTADGVLACCGRSLEHCRMVHCKWLHVFNLSCCESLV